MRIRKSTPKFSSFLFLLAVLSILSAPRPAFAYEAVQFLSIDGATDLTAYLSRPEGDGPYPAVILLHGCGGLGFSGSVSSIYSSWTRELNAVGLAVLMVDSAGSRGLGATCGKGKKRIRMYRERPKDAYGALAYLQTRDFILPDKIGVVGWSQGGGIVLLSIVHDSIGRPKPPPEHDFAVAAAFYPALCNDRIQSRPFTKVEPGSWSTKVPLLVLFGAADNWTRLEPCLEFIDAARTRGSPVSIIAYPGAYHGFDAPSRKMTKLPKYKTVSGVIPIVGTHEESRKDALQRLPAFLAKYLLPQN